MTNVDACKALIDSQAAKGLSKYKMPLEQSDATVSRLARHGAEEMADALAYFVALEVQAAKLELDAARYRWLRARDLDAIHKGGVFAGKTPDNLVINGDDLDRYVDEAIAAEAGTVDDQSAPGRNCPEFDPSPAPPHYPGFEPSERGR